MRTTLRLASASIAVASLVGTAAAATAEPSSAPAFAPVAADAGTGSSAVDSGSAAARSAVEFLGRGDLIGIIVLLGVTPFQMLTGGICDLATMSALPNPCAPRRLPY
ncbi:hypothetical protein [Nocardia xishanensis]|uniref:hypothetical protein n=1 Tax=Nocardia xishanensis TaxID=238964 RepID=UPI000AD6ABC8|nr:hypothetical protein [Nocardia xishanensis]